MGPFGFGKFPSFMADLQQIGDTVDLPSHIKDEMEKETWKHDHGKKEKTNAYIYNI